MNVAAELRAAIAEANAMPPSHAKVEALELIARRAEQHNENFIACRALLHLYNAANQIAAPERKLAAYTALRALADRAGDELASQREYVVSVGGHLLHGLAGFPEISLAQIDALFAEQEQLYAEIGRSPYALIEARLTTEIDVGRMDRARAAYDQLERVKPAPNECGPCRINQRVWALQRFLRDAEAIELAVPLLDGRMKCDSTPHSTQSSLLQALVRCGERDRARELYFAAHRYVLGHPTNVSCADELLEFAAQDDQYVRGKNLLERVLPHTAFSSKQTVRAFYTSAAQLFDAMLRGGRTAITIAMPAALPMPAALRDAPNPRPLAPLRAWFAERAHELAARFDRRNGNTSQSDAVVAAIGPAAPLS